MKLDQLAEVFGAKVVFSLENVRGAVADCASSALFDCPQIGFTCPQGFICENFLCYDNDCTGQFLCVDPFGCGDFGCLGSYCGTDSCP